MSLFSSEHTSVLENQFYKDFLDSQKLSVEELREMKKELFEYNKEIQAMFLNSSKENTEAVKNFTNQLNPPGSEQKTFESYNKKDKEDKDSGSIKTILESLKPSGLDSTTASVKTLWEEIKNIFVTGFLTLVALPFIGPLVKWFDENFGTNFTKTYNSFMNSLETIYAPVRAVFQDLKEWGSVAVNWLRELIADPRKVFEDFKIGLENYYNQFLKFLGGSAGTENVFERTWIKISGYFDSFLESVKKFNANHQEDYDRILTNGRNQLVDFFGSLMGYSEQTRDELKLIFDNTGGIFNYIKKLLEDFYNSGVLKDKFDSMVEKMSQAVRDKSSQLVDFLSKTISDFIFGLKDKLILSLFPPKMKKETTMVYDPQRGYREVETGNEVPDWSWAAKLVGAPEAYEREQKKLQAAKEETEKKEAQRKLLESERNERQRKFDEMHPEVSKAIDDLTNKIKTTTESLKTETKQETLEQKWQDAKMYAGELGKTLAPYLEELKEELKQLKNTTIISTPGGSSSSPAPMVPNGVSNNRNAYLDWLTRNRLLYAP